MTTPVTIHAPGDVLVENVDVPEEMIAAALAALDAGRMRAHAFDGTRLAKMPPAFLVLDHEDAAGGRIGDPDEDVPLVGFLAENDAPTDAAVMADAAIAALRGRRVSGQEILRLHTLLSFAHDGRDDDAIVVCSAPSPWCPNGSVVRDTRTGETRTPTLDPDFMRLMPVSARLSIAYVDEREAIGLSCVTSLADQEADPMDRLRALQEVDADPIGSGPDDHPWEPLR